MTEIITLAGTIALLIWALKLIQKGVLAGFGNELRSLAKKNDGKALPAFFSGIAIAGVSQSSTATALLATTLTEQRILTGVTALFIILGADIGTAGAAFFASVYKGQLLQSILLLIGAVLAIRSNKTRPRSIGQVMIGIGLLLIAISSLNAGAATWKESVALGDLLRIIEDAPIILVALAAILTYSVYSSLAVILMIAQAHITGLVDAEAALLLVVGANLGGGALPLLTRLGAERTTITPLLINFVLRAGAGIVIIIFSEAVIPQLEQISSPLTFAVFAHLGLNLGVAFIGLILGPWLHDIVLRMDWWQERDNADGVISSLDEAALAQPDEGMACAKREALRMADLVEKMLVETGNAISEPNIDQRDAISELDDDVDEIYVETKHYIARLTQTSLNEYQSGQVIDLLNFIANMEHIGDIIDAGLSEATHKQATFGIAFSDEGQKEIAELHALVVRNFQLAINAFVTDNEALAKQLVDNKKAVRDLAEKSSSTHLTRLGSGDPQTLQTSSIHIDVLRDLRRINSHLVATAYPILTAAGHVRKTKWKIKTPERLSSKVVTKVLLEK